MNNFLLAALVVMLTVMSCNAGYYHGHHGYYSPYDHGYYSPYKGYEGYGIGPIAAIGIAPVFGAGGAGIGIGAAGAGGGIGAAGAGIGIGIGTGFGGGVIGGRKYDPKGHYDYPHHGYSGKHY